MGRQVSGRGQAVVRRRGRVRALPGLRNAIESVNARIRSAVRARGHFPNPQAALKCVYMALMSLDPTGNGRKRWTIRWKAPLNAFAITFEGRMPTDIK